MGNSGEKDSSFDGIISQVKWSFGMSSKLFLLTEHRQQFDFMLEKVFNDIFLLLDDVWQFQGNREIDDDSI